MLIGVCIALVVAIPLLVSTLVPTNQIGLGLLLGLVWFVAAGIWVALEGDRVMRVVCLAVILVLWNFFL